MLVLDDENELFEANIREKKLSDVLLKNVERFDNDGDKVVVLVKGDNNEAQENAKSS